MFGKICDFPAVFGNIDKSNPLSIVDMIICTLGNFVLIIFVVGSTLFMWADTAMGFPVHTESETAGIPLFIVFFLWLAFEQYYNIHVYFKCHCRLYH